MTLLFIDSTYDITLGLLNKQSEWSEFKRFTGQKASIILQTEVYTLLQSQSIKAEYLDGIVTIAGPGFYTGLRLSEGFADVLKFFNKPLYSFYSYEIPQWCGVKNGVWMTKAYRGEYFFHHWGDSEKRNDLVSSKDLANYMSQLKQPIYIHSLPALDQASIELLKNPVSTHDLLQSNSKVIFYQVVSQRLKRESFYFRAPEDEFKVSP